MKNPSPEKRSSCRSGLVLVFALFLLALFASLSFGATWISPLETARTLFEGRNPQAQSITNTIVWDLRLARTLIAATAGATLGCAGVLLQGLFRNPLADPYALGVSSGAGLGAVLALGLGIASPLIALSAMQLCAFFGAILAAALVFAIATVAGKRDSTAALLLTGIAMAAFLGSLVSLFMALRQQDLQRVFFWLLGSFGGKSWSELASLLPSAALCIAGSFFLARPLDVLGAGEESASSMGLDIGKVRFFAVGASAFGTAATVSAGGIIGFVGLVGPHLARLFVGHSHRQLIPAAALSGAALLMIADAISRSIAAPIELPISVVTALFGAPLFIWLLIHRGAAAQEN